MVTPTASTDETSPLLPAYREPNEPQLISEANNRSIAGSEEEIMWTAELKILLEQSNSLIGTYLLQYFYNLMIVLVASRLGTNELATVSVGIVTMNITGYAVSEGIATSLDTLCAQAYGSGNKKLVGLHVQRMILFQLLVAIPIGTIWILSPWILRPMVPQEWLPALAGSFLRISVIGIPGYAIFEAGKRFAQAQGNYTAGLVVLIICGPINIFLNWLFVFVCQRSHLFLLRPTLLVSGF
jgi:multidrug resistance protein, MATE family